MMFKNQLKQNNFKQMRPKLKILTFAYFNYINFSYLIEIRIVCLIPLGL